MHTQTRSTIGINNRLYHVHQPPHLVIAQLRYVSCTAHYPPVPFLCSTALLLCHPSCPARPSSRPPTLLGEGIPVLVIRGQVLPVR